MPNLDGGHYFLTVLAPVRTDRLDDRIPGRSRSHRSQLAQKLALLAAGRQTAASPADAWPSPFAANRLNHFVRMVIIDAPPFNGRNAGDTLLDQLQGRLPLDPQPVDRLTTPFLLFAADFDAPGDGPTALRAYADALWATMAADLRVIFGHCLGFDAVDDAAGFHAYLERCQIETTMPFNDYWAEGLKVSSTKPPVSALKAAGIVAGGAVAVWLLALLADGLLTLYGAGGGFAARIAAVVGWGALLIPVVIVLVMLVLWLLYGWVLRRGALPFAAAPGSDLPTVLKALYLQQQFTRFAVDAQGLDAAALHARFGTFLAATQPADTAAPTQRPGVVAAESAS